MNAAIQSMLTAYKRHAAGGCFPDQLLLLAIKSHPGYESYRLYSDCQGAEHVL